MRRLDAKAEYVQSSDRINIKIWFVDPDEDVSHPEEVFEGKAIAIFGNMVSNTFWKFDKFYGNGTDEFGGFKIFWSKPPQTNNISVRIEVIDDSGTEWTKTVPVITVENDGSSYLAQNPPNGILDPTGI